LVAASSFAIASFCAWLAVLADALLAEVCGFAATGDRAEEGAGSAGGVTASATGGAGV
jgi:hypothetical protein